MTARAVSTATPGEGSNGSSEGIGSSRRSLVPSIYTVALLALLGAIFLIALAPRLDTDLFWHLKVGQHILTAQSVPSRDYMSYTFVGHPWTDHEWLAEVVLYMSTGVMGLWGPTAIFAVVICATFALVYLRMVRLGVNRVAGLFILCAAALGSSGSWGPRIQLVTLLFLATYGLVLDRFLRTRESRTLWVLPLVMLLWANVHGGFVLGLVLIGTTLVGEYLNHRSHLPEALGLGELRQMLVALAATFAMTIINPNTVRQLLYPLTFILPNAFTNQIQESASPDFHQPLVMLFEALLLLLIAALAMTRAQTNWTRLLTILVFTHLALNQIRSVPLWCVVVSPLLALTLQECGPELRRFLPDLGYQRREVRGRVRTVLNGLLLGVVLLVLIAETHAYITPARMNAVEQQSYPKGATRYLGAHPLPAHVFTNYEWGGYLLWHLFPRYRDFMDSRADTLYTAKMLNAYLDAYSGSGQWAKVLNGYRVGTVMVKSDAPLASLLGQSSSWRRVYRDTTAVVFTRTGA